MSRVRPLVNARSLGKGNPALKSIDLALDMAQVHLAVVSRGYAESKYYLKELVAMMRSGKPVIPLFYDVELVDLQSVEHGLLPEAFEKHKSKERTAKKVYGWAGALRELAEITGFRLADYKRDEAKLKQEVVNEVALLIPSNWQWKLNVTECVWRVRPFLLYYSSDTMNQETPM